MNKELTRLWQISKKKERLIIGLMSGTSLDGLDIALCAVAGNGLETKLTLQHFRTVPYPANLKQEIKNICFVPTADLQQICLMNAYLGTYHAELILASLKEWQVDPETVDIIASHGQTIFHAPKSLHGQTGKPNATLQIGDGDHLAVKTGIITLSDFRQKHLAAGGEGAPLAVYGDYLLFSKKGQDRIMLNIGGIANFTFLPGDLNPTRIFSTDVGPGNTLMDAYMQRNYPQQYYDQNGALAASGQYNPQLVAALLNHPFFTQYFPKTTGPELFNLAYLESAQLKAQLTQLSPADVVASLNRFTAAGIALAIKNTGVAGSAEIYVSGGGLHNQTLLHNIQELLPSMRLFNLHDLGVNPDAKEAVLFAILANECLAGNSQPIKYNNTMMPAVAMGKISLPA